MGCLGAAVLAVVLVAISVASASSEAEKIKKQLLRARERFNLLLVQRFQLDSMKRQLTLMARRFGEETTFPEILHFLTTTAHACSLRVKSLKRSVEPPRAPPPSREGEKGPAPPVSLVRIPVTMEVEGRFHRVADFLGDITNAHFIFQVKKLEFKAVEELHPDVRVLLSADVVFIKEKK